MNKPGVILELSTEEEEYFVSCVDEIELLELIRDRQRDYGGDFGALYNQIVHGPQLPRGIVTPLSEYTHPPRPEGSLHCSDG